MVRPLKVELAATNISKALKGHTSHLPDALEGHLILVGSHPRLQHYVLALRRQQPQAPIVIVTQDEVRTRRNATAKARLRVGVFHVMVPLSRWTAWHGVVVICREKLVRCRAPIFWKAMGSEKVHLVAGLRLGDSSASSFLYLSLFDIFYVCA